MQFYGIDDPLGLPARRFLLLTAHLPAESRVYTLLQQREEEDPAWYKRAFDQAMGRPSRPSRRISQDAFIAGMR